MVNAATPAFNSLFHCNFRSFCGTLGWSPPGCKSGCAIGQPLPQQRRVHTKARRNVPQTYRRCRTHDLVEPAANRVLIGDSLPSPQQLDGYSKDGWELVQIVHHAQGMRSIGPGQVAVYLRHRAGG